MTTPRPPRPGRRWTILLVPHDHQGTRSIELGPRAVRGLTIGAGAAVLLVVAAAVALFTSVGTPAARLAALENARLEARLAELDRRLLALGDTLDEIARRDEQIRLLAGIDGDSTVRTPADAARDAELAAARPLPTLEAGAPTPRPVATDRQPVEATVTGRLGARPFLGRLGFRSRPDIDALITRATRLAASFRAVNDTLARNMERLANTPSIMPTSGWLSSHFSESRIHPVLHVARPHEGIDVTAPMGAPIISPAAGTVLSAGRETGYGLTVQIDHGNGIITRYAHCSRLVVHVGQRVTRGQVIAAVGNTGLTTGPHLHYEIHVDGRAVDPLTYVLPNSIPD